MQAENVQKIQQDITINMFKTISIANKLKVTFFPFSMNFSSPRCTMHMRMFCFSKVVIHTMVISLTVYNEGLYISVSASMFDVQ